MRWSEMSVQLPLQPLSALERRAPGALAATPSADGLVVIVCSDVRDRVMLHVRGSDEERGGLLIGEVFTDDADMSVGASRAVVLTRAVPALDFSSSGFSLRMEAGVWERARVERSAVELAVGWYHSHPGLGAFFSVTDRRTQAAFFPHPYSVGWVVDPSDGGEAIFVGRESLPPGALLGLASLSGCGSVPIPK